MGISVDDWMAAIREVSGDEDDDPSALTVKEFCAVAHVGTTKAGMVLHQMVETGRAKKCRKAITDSAGRRQHATAYRLLTKEPAHVTRTQHPRRSGTE